MQPQQLLCVQVLHNTRREETSRPTAWAPGPRGRRGSPPTAARDSWTQRSLPRASGETGGMCSCSSVALKRGLERSARWHPEAGLLFFTLCYLKQHYRTDGLRNAHSKISASVKGDEKQQQSHPCATLGQVGPCEGSAFTTEKSDH